MSEADFLDVDFADDDWDDDEEAILYPEYDPWKNRRDFLLSDEFSKAILSPKCGNPCKETPCPQCYKTFKYFIEVKRPINVTPNSSTLRNTNK